MHISLAFNGVLLNAVIMPLKIDIKKNNRRVKKFDSSSKIPYLVFDSLPFIDILVSLPQYTTKPQILPLAKTVFYHIIFSSDSDSF
jgi:hypothetical protein